MICVCARRAARHRVAKQLLRYGHIYREGKKAWTKRHIAWVRRQRLERPARPARRWSTCCAHLDSVDAQIAALDTNSTRSPRREPWSDPVRWLCCFRGIADPDRARLLAEIGDFRRFATARELMSFLGLTASEYSSGDQRHRGHITKTGTAHARRLLIEAAWHYQHAPRVSQRIAAVQPHVPPDIAERAFSAQVRLHHRHRAPQQPRQALDRGNRRRRPRTRRLPLGRHDPPTPQPATERDPDRLTHTHPLGPGGRRGQLEDPRRRLCDSDSRT